MHTRFLRCLNPAPRTCLCCCEALANTPDGTEPLEGFLTNTRHLVQLTDAQRVLEQQTLLVAEAALRRRAEVRQDVLQRRGRQFRVQEAVVEKHLLRQTSKIGDAATASKSAFPTQNC